MIENVENFRVADLDGLVLVDFWAEWCNPCKLMAPVLDQFVEENPDVKILKLDTEKNLEVIPRHGILSLPTIIVYKNGQEVDRIIGFLPKFKLKQRVGEYSPTLK